ncbi:(R)-mandelonitrile lyase [Jannaschia aquimarina]|uniref:Cupin domain protein n=1 Tax=Jannaschia aquimarina TaxID=935700 RepID=A0A0D1DC54_9RHOB|nr:cupin domain-containing protein [Jannaschia aquimarina]KIT17588.1 Cupin domain protein [Jannaschia aquimarina]SNS72063.1 transcriptional regulator [Jannaschia aquimarina]
MEIERADAGTGTAPDPSYFTGEVRMRRLQDAEDPARAVVLSVTFQPGARTNWHTHPLGQTLIVTDGRGWVQREGGPREEVGPGDVIRFPAGERHWHGATADQAMTHIAIQERLDGRTADWQEPVADADYSG